MATLITEQQQQAISAVLAEDRNSWHLMPSSAELTVLEGPFHEQLSTMVYTLKHALANCLAANDDHLVTGTKSVIASDLCTCYESALISQVLDKCCILDPRFKATYIADRKLTESELQAEVIHP